MCCNEADGITFQEMQQKDQKALQAKISGSLRMEFEIVIDGKRVMGNGES